MMEIRKIPPRTRPIEECVRAQWMAWESATRAYLEPQGLVYDDVLLLIVAADIASGSGKLP